MKNSNQRIFFYVLIIVITIVFVIAGFSIIGSPAQRRLERLDQQRVSDLQQIQLNLSEYWQRRQDLPKTLEELSLDAGVKIPQDPARNSDYEYKRISMTQFHLCADFSAKGDGSERGYYSVAFPYALIKGNDWAHEAGRSCFEREIDVEEYQRRQADGLPSEFPNRVY